MSEDRISDRHLRAVNGLAPADDVASLRVRIVAGAATCTIAGQHLVLCLANLLGRLTDLVGEIQIDMPTIDTLVPLPFESGPIALAEAIVRLVEWAVGEEIVVRVAPEDRAADIHLCIGDDIGGAQGAMRLYAIADGWRAWVGSEPNLPSQPNGFTSSNPLGPFLAACLLTGEVFKRARGTTRGRWLEDFGHSLWTGETGTWSQLQDGPDLAGLALPPLYLVGAGAVGQGLLNLIGSANFASSYVVTIDDDRHDATNFNRCFIAGIGDKEAPKVEAVSRYRRITGIGGLECRGTLKDYIQRAMPELRLDLAEREANDLFDCVVSCVDKGASRQDVQGLWPRILMGGSTLGLSAKVNVYDPASGTACLGCHNPAEKDGERLRQIEQQVRAMTIEARREFLKGAPDLENILAYLAAAEDCGRAGEAQFRAFVTQGEREFSVSFVSMGAAVLLASRLFSRLLFDGAPSNALAPMTSLAFLNGSIDHSRTSVDAACQRCGGDPRISFQRNWPGH